MPGSLLVGADCDGEPGGQDLPATAEATMTVFRFLTALRDRADDGGRIDTTAGVYGIAGFAEAMTGRAGRIQAARNALEDASADDRTADAGVQAAERARDRAAERVTAARAVLEADDLGGQVRKLREKNTQISDNHPT